MNGLVKQTSNEILVNFGFNAHDNSRIASDWNDYAHEMQVIQLVLAVSENNANYIVFKLWRNRQQTIDNINEFCQLLPFSDAWSTANKFILMATAPSIAKDLNTMLGCDIAGLSALATINTTVNTVADAAACAIKNLTRDDTHHTAQINTLLAMTYAKRAIRMATKIAERCQHHVAITRSYQERFTYVAEVGAIQNVSNFVTCVNYTENLCNADIIAFAKIMGMLCQEANANEDLTKFADAVAEQYV